jgi:hypothetical protein
VVTETVSPISLWEEILMHDSLSLKYGIHQRAGMKSVGIIRVSHESVAETFRQLIQKGREEGLPISPSRRCRQAYPTALSDCSVKN